MISEDSFLRLLVRLAAWVLMGVTLYGVVFCGWYIG